MQFLEVLRKRVEEAEKRLEELNTLIEIAEEAGEDVSAYLIKRDELRARIKAWKEALEKRLEKRLK